METEKKPKRSVQACTRCRQQKMKCDGDGSSTCARCQRVGAACIFEPAWKASAQKHAPSSVLRGDRGQLGDTSYGPSPPDSANFHKRRRLNLDTLSTTSSPSGGESRMPYTTVLDLEGTSAEHVRETSRVIRRNGSSGSAYDYDAKIGIPIDEALEMYQLFGQRVAPFMPTYVDIDFTKQPATPLFLLAAIYTIARYLPETTTLRVKCGSALRELLEGLLFERTDNKDDAFFVDTLHGLAILYSYCEANDRDASGDDECWRFDMLSMKGIIEAYAVKIGLPGVHSTKMRKVPVFQLYWLWLYTFSHYTATVHGCARTLWAAADVYQAQHWVELHYDNPRVLTLLGEVELCLLWERVAFASTFTPQTVDEELAQWHEKWRRFLDDPGSAPGRQLRFHQRYAVYRLRSWLLASEHANLDREKLEKDKSAAAYEFLKGVTSMSPIVKDRLRYMCDYAFVVMTYISVCVLRDVKSSTDRETAQGSSLTNLVRDMAALMQSYSGIKGSRAAIYGQALNAICLSIDRIATVDAEYVSPNNEVSTTSYAPIMLRSHPSSSELQQVLIPARTLLQHAGSIPTSSTQPFESESAYLTPHSADQQQHVPALHSAGSGSYLDISQSGFMFPYLSGSTDYLDVFNDIVGINHVLPGSSFGAPYPPNM